MRKEPGRGLEPDEVDYALLEAESKVLNAALTNVGGDLRDLRIWSDEKVKELHCSVAQVEEHDAELEKARADLHNLERRSEEQAKGWNAETERLRSDLRVLRDWSDDKTEELRAHIRELYSSWAYRIGRRLGLAPEPIQEKDSE